LELLTPGLRNTDGRGKLTFTDQDGSFNKNGVFLKLAEVGFTNAL
jgi:hypothetical protein